MTPCTHRRSDVVDSIGSPKATSTACQLNPASRSAHASPRIRLLCRWYGARNAGSNVCVFPHTVHRTRCTQSHATAHTGPGWPLAVPVCTERCR